jgi:polysaccharide biosynthesis transport protein
MRDNAQRMQQDGGGLMLQANKYLPADEARQGIWGPSGMDTISSFTNIIRHQVPTIVISMAAFTALGLIYLFTTPATYLATATVVIDARNAQSFEQQQEAVAGQSSSPVETRAIQTQVEILKSENILRRVVRKLQLANDAEFVGPFTGLRGAVNWLFSMFFGAAQVSDSALESIAVQNLKSERTISVTGQSHMIEIDFVSLDPYKAARIANALGDAYLDEHLEAKNAAARRASVWLQDRSKELEAEVSAARQAVVEFKTKNNIVIVNAGERQVKKESEGGRLMDDQQITDISTQLVLAQTATSEARARYERTREIMKQEIPDASVADALKNEVIIKLRGQYVDVASREAIWSQKYGQNHLATVNLRSQMHEILRSIRDEMRKIDESAKSDYEIAKTREQSIRDSLGQAVSKSHMTDQVRIQLEGLESAAQTTELAYDNFLGRFTQAIQQQSFPISEAHIVDLAEKPLGKYHIKQLIVLLVIGVTGLVVSFCAAYLRERSDRVFRSSGQVEDSLEVKCLAMLPNLNTGKSSNVPARQNAQASSASLTVPKRPHSMLSHILDEPYSQFTEALRSVKVACDLRGGAEPLKVIGLTSTLPHEGKTMTAVNFAQLIAQGGCSTILIDADLRNPTLSRQLATKDCGLFDVITGRRTIEDAVGIDRRTGLKLLSSGSKSEMLNTNELLASSAMKKLIEALRGNYAYIIVDLPPLIPIVDARATANFVDAYIYIVEWGRTRIDTAKHSLCNAPELRERLLGVVLNKVDTTKIRLYEPHLGNYYRKYSPQYSCSGRSGEEVRGKRLKS